MLGKWEDLGKNPPCRHISTQLFGFFVWLYQSYKFLKLYKEFNEADIYVLVFKGIICRQLYPNPDQRISSDEDILVSAKDFKKCEEIILANGLVKTEEEYDEEEHFYDMIREEIDHANKKYLRCLENCEEYMNDTTLLENVYWIE